MALPASLIAEIRTSLVALTKKAYYDGQIEPIMLGLGAVLGENQQHINCAVNTGLTSEYLQLAEVATMNLKAQQVNAAVTYNAAMQHFDVTFSR